MQGRAFLLVTGALASTLFSAVAAPPVKVKITSIKAPAIRYDQVEFLSTSPAVWVRDTPPDQGRYLRFLLLQSPQSPPEFRIESWTYGDEGCCQRMVRARQFDIFTSEFLNAYAPQPSDDCKAKFEFGRWLTLTSFSFQAMCKDFVAEHVHLETLSIRSAHAG